MPFYFKESDIVSQVAGLRSVLIVPCGFCPAASLAVGEQKPYMEPFRRLLKIEVYESYIQSLQLCLEEQGIRTAVFGTTIPHEACMWTHGRRRAFAKRAQEFDGVVVLGCEGAVQTVRDAVGPSACRVIQGMEVEGLMNVAPIVRFPAHRLTGDARHDTHHTALSILGKRLGDSGGPAVFALTEAGKSANLCYLGTWLDSSLGSWCSLFWSDPVPA